MKREPYQIRGYEVGSFLSGFWGGKQPPIDAEWIRFWREGGTGECPGAGTDPLMDEKLPAWERFAIPSLKVPLCGQSGTHAERRGDNYGSARFFNGIRALTRHFNALIMDEVQTGFGLGGTFFWHQQFQFRMRMASRIIPNWSFARRKPRWGSPSPSGRTLTDAVSGASAIRGRLHAEMGRRDHRSVKFMGWRSGVWRLGRITGTGDRGAVQRICFAFDPPAAAIADGW